MSWLNYHHLYYFWMIAKEGSVTAACKKLRLAQPTVSSQLKHFEDSIGKPLFIRKSKKLILTEAGRIVFDHANSIFKIGEKLVESIQNETARETIRFNVGVLSSLPKKDVYDFLQTGFVRKHVQVNLKLGSLEELAVELVNHNIDAIISHSKAPSDMKGVFSYHLERVPIIIAGAKEYKSLRRGYPKSLTRQPFFLPSYKSYLRHEVEQFFRDKDVQPDIRGEIQDSEMLRILAVTGQGLVTIERTAISDLLKSKDLVVIGDNTGIWEDYYLIVTEQSREHPLVQEMLKKFQG